MAMSVDAQTAFIPTQKMHRPTQKVTIEKTLQMPESQIKARPAKAKKVETDNIYSEMVCVGCDYNETCYITNYVSFEEANFQDEDGTVYNVQMNGIVSEGTTALGVYDAEAGTLTFPSQVVAESTTPLGSSTDYGKVELYGIGLDDYFTDSVVFVKTEAGFELAEEYKGCYLYLPDYNNGEGTGLSGSFYCRLVNENGTMEYYTTGARFMDNPESTEGWDTGHRKINYEDWETSININGFLGMSCITVDINEDGQTCTILPGQMMDNYNYGEPYNYLCFVCYPPNEEGYLTRDDNASLEGEVYKDVTLNDGTECAYYIRFFGVNDEGKITNRQYFGGFTSEDESGESYWIGGYFCDLELVLEKGVTDGIKDNPQMRIDNIKNTKTYNMMGQQVDRKNTKGILIRGGKKYIAK